MGEEARTLREMIGRDLRWWERLIFNLLVGGWRQFLIPLGFVPRVVVGLPILLAGLFMQWAGAWLERAADSFASLTQLSRSPWARRPDEATDLWAVPRVVRALRLMKLLPWR